AAPKLETGRKYAVRVTARNKGNGKDLFFKNNGNSMVCFFRYGAANQNDVPKKDSANPNEQKKDVQEDYADPCTALNCAPQPLAAAVPSNTTYTVGDEVQIGYFTLKLTNLSSSSAGNLSGEGTIDAPIFKTKLKATFQGLKVNPDNKVYAGKAIGAYDPGAQVDQALKSLQGDLANLAADKVKDMTEYVKTNEKYIDKFANADAQGLPFAWKKIVNSQLEMVDIAAIEFAPDGAHMNAFLEMPIPEAENQILAFGQKNICFHPTGLSVGGLQKLTMLGKDKTFPWGNNIDMTLKAAGGNDGGTYVRWDCEGYHEMQIDGFFTFKSSLIEKANGAGPVKAAFTFSNVKSWGDLLGEITMDPFTIKGLKGLKLSFNNVVLDFSDTRNADGMAFPANYNGGTGNDWRGFYFKEIRATLPNYLKKNGKSVEIALANAFINRQGFTGTASVQPVFDLGSGDVGGWAFSMEKIELGVLNNSLTKGAFNGKLKMPITSTQLGYSCLIASANDSVKTTFQVENIGDIDVDMWGAKMTIADGSSIGITSAGNDVTVKATLSGGISIDKQFVELKGASVKIPGMEFEDLTVQNKKPYLSASLFKFASPQKFFAGFPVSIKPEDGIQVKFAEDGTKAGLTLGFHVGLDGNAESAISGGTTFTLWGKMEQKDGKQNWLPAAPTLESINIKASVASCDMEGKIDLYKGDPTFGDGFRGAIKVAFRPLVTLSATVQFGSTNYQNNDTYRYWYVDAMAVMGAGIPVFPGFGIYGFGGGAYYHMKPQAVVPVAASLEGDPNSASKFKQDEAGQTNTGVTYLPSPKIAFGFKATLVMGTMPKPNAFNGDITLEASFFQGGGLNEISLSGNGYFVSIPDPKARPAKDKALVWAGVMFKYSADSAAFDGKLDVHINLKAGKLSLLEGGGPAMMHFSKNKWFIKLGEPDDRIKLKVLGLVDIGSYLMVGKNSLPGMPPLPTTPINFQQELPSFNDANQRKPAAANGTGFAMGQQLDINTGRLKFLIFYAQIAISFGYDISILDLDQTCEFANGKIGLNGWYATGQVYAGLAAEVGLDINLWFLKADVSLFKVGLFAGLKAGLPNPTWMQGEVSGKYSALNGLLSGHCNFKFKYGDYCDPNSGDPFGGVKVISEINPKGDSADVFSYPEVVYNLPIGEAVAVDVANDKGDITVNTFRFGVKSIDIVNQKTKAKVAGDYALANKGFSSLFSPDDMLDEVTKYRMTARVYGEKLEKNGWKHIGENDNPNKEHLDSMSQDFTTASAPEDFPNSNVIATLPARMQRYYLYKQTYGGHIDFKQFPSNVRNLKPADDDYSYKYVARFQEVGAGSKVISEVPIGWDAAGKRVTYEMPGTLKPKTVYIIQIVRKKVKDPGSMGKGTGSGVSKSTVSTAIGDKQTIDIRQARLNSIKLGDNEFMVYQLAYKTSEFETFDKKYFSYDLKEIKTGTGDYSHTMNLTLVGKEPMDWYDLHATSYALNPNTTRYVEPIIRLEAVDLSKNNNDSYWSQLHESLFDYIQVPFLKNMLTLTPATYNPMTYKLNPVRLRTYPAADAYGDGSRLTNGSSIPDSMFPTHAVGMWYDGNGTATKLSNSEINASYWKGIDDIGPGPGGNPGIIKINDGEGPKPPGNGMVNQNMGLQQNTVNKLLIRYDAPTVLVQDRARVLKELMNRYGLNPSSFSMEPKWWSFLDANSKTVIEGHGGENNPYYWDMHLNQASDFRVDISYGYGTSYPKPIKFNPPSK
ncbi:MAG: hypothetical protein ABIR47_06625, partial [Candidatus Kapaibacterium sp.]